MDLKPVIAHSHQGLLERSLGIQQILSFVGSKQTLNYPRANAETIKMFSML